MRAMLSAAGRVAALALVVIAARQSAAQGIERRVSSAPSGNVQFHFAARENVCGDGRNYLRSDFDSWYGSFYDVQRSPACEKGPVRVMLLRDGRELVRVQTFAGPLYTDPSATDLGAFPAADAAAYLLGVAAQVDGRPGRDALMPAMLADSALVTRPLLALVRDAQRSRDVRRSALSWLVRRRGERGGLTAEEVSRTLNTIARDETENRNLREAAVSSLGRLESGEGINALVAMTENMGDSWLARRAVDVLASSGDPRSRVPLRAAAERTDLSEEARVQAINGIAGEFSTSRDGEFLRTLYRKMNTERLQNAVMNGVASIGGSESRDWMLAIARNTSEDIRQRKHAIELADRIGLSVADLSKLYDDIDDAEVRATIIGELAQLGTQAASTKLIAIAKNDGSVSNRRRAIQALGRFDDPKVREALKDLVSR